MTTPKINYNILKRDLEQGLNDINGISRVRVTKMLSCLRKGGRVVIYVLIEAVLSTNIHNKKVKHFLDQISFHFDAEIRLTTKPIKAMNVVSRKEVTF